MTTKRERERDSADDRIGHQVKDYKDLRYGSPHLTIIPPITTLLHFIVIQFKDYLPLYQLQISS